MVYICIVKQNHEEISFNYTSSYNFVLLNEA